MGSQQTRVVWNVRPPDATTDFHGVAEAEQILSWTARRWFEQRSGSGSASLGSGSGSKQTGAESPRSGGLSMRPARRCSG
jgi:hypothetical protein